MLAFLFLPSAATRAGGIFKGFRAVRFGVRGTFTPASFSAMARLM